MPVEVYYNADFDLSLRPRPLSLRSQRMAARIRALTLHGILGASARDEVLIRTGIPEGFLTYLARMGFEPPSVGELPASRSGPRLLPLGWNAEAIALDGNRQGKPTLETVRWVNSRLFAQVLQRELSLGHDAGVAIRSVAEAEDHLAAASSRGSAWIAKANHGNAGTANRRLREAGPSTADRRVLESLLAEDDWVVLEPWRHRLRDLCCVFEVDPYGGLEGPRIHEAMHTADGGFIGALFHPDPGFAEPWVESLAETAGRVTRLLHREGYFGPVALDSFVFLQAGRERLRPVVDLNCRQPASFAASRWLSRLTGSPVMLWRFFTRRRLMLPESYEDWARRLGSRAYSASTERGVLLASPLSIRLDGHLTPSPKVGVAIVGDDIDQVREQESWLRACFER